MKSIVVVCGVILKNDKVFIARRKPEKSLGGYWEFPGGKLEGSETEDSALKRELSEELGMKVKIQKRLASNTHVYQKVEIELIPFLCEYVEMDTLEFTDHDQVKWIAIPDLLTYKLSEADIPIAQNVIDYFYKDQNVRSKHEERSSGV